MTAPDNRETRPLWQDPRFAPGLAVFGLIALVAGLVLAFTSGDDPSNPEAVRAANGSDPATVVDEASQPESVLPSTLVGVKIDNAVESRPQVGLDAARIIFEVPVEGGSTRFLAFYEPATPLVVGPVRSLRPVDADLVAVLSSQVVTTGGQPFVTQAVTASGVELIGAGTAPPLFATDAPAPHNQFIDLTEMTPAPVPHRLPVGDLTGGAEATEVVIPYANEVQWDFEDGTYVRSEGGELAMVRPTPDAEPVAFATDVLVVLSAARRSAGYQDSAGADVPTFDVIGGGRLRIFADGEVTEGTWSRSAQGDPFVFRDDDGDTVGLPEGRRVVIQVVDRAQQPRY